MHGNPYIFALTLLSGLVIPNCKLFTFYIFLSRLPCSLATVLDFGTNRAFIVNWWQSAEILLFVESEILIDVRCNAFQIFHKNLSWKFNTLNSQLNS